MFTPLVSTKKTQINFACHRNVIVSGWHLRRYNYNQPDEQWYGCFELQLGKVRMNLYVWRKA